MTQTTSLHAETSGREAFREEAKPEAAMATTVNQAPLFPRLPLHVERLRGQKVCSYCKHSIEEDPYFRYEGYWQRVLQNKTYLLRYVRLELSHWAAEIFYFMPAFKAWLLRVKERVLLPGWVRCANPDCGQLYHASCWYQISKAKGCLRCRAHAAKRVE